MNNFICPDTQEKCTAHPLQCNTCCWLQLQKMNKSNGVYTVNDLKEGLITTIINNNEPLTMKDTGWLKIDYDNPPKGEVLLLTNSKTILKGDWYENNLVKGFGWRTERSQWAFAPPDGKEYLTLTSMFEVHYYRPLPSTEIT